MLTCTRAIPTLGLCDDSSVCLYIYIYYTLRYDGHAGTPCADYLTRHLHKNVLLAYTKNPVEYSSQAEGVAAALEQQMNTLTELTEVVEQVKQLREIERADDGSSVSSTAL